MFKRKNLFTIGCYNVENLFDIKDDPLTYDDQFTPNGKNRWNKSKYKNKLRKISTVISKIGTNSSAYPPVVMGLVEVENNRVLKDLIAHKNLREFNYNFIHYDSLDERGIDVALLYNPNFFKPENSKVYDIGLLNSKGEKDHTRDILLVSGRLNGELIYFVVNHWPSRREGVSETEKKRIKASEMVLKIIGQIREEDESAKIVIMGDFNDDPVDRSIKELLNNDNLYNPMEDLYEKGLGSLKYRGKWNLFDQIIFSKSFFDSNLSEHSFVKAGIFNERWLEVHKGKLKGSPFRTYIGPWYKGGFSDHFPVYACFENDI